MCFPLPGPWSIFVVKIILFFHWDSTFERQTETAEDTAVSEVWQLWWSWFSPEVCAKALEDPGLILWSGLFRDPAPLRQGAAKKLPWCLCLLVPNSLADSHSLVHSLWPLEHLPLSPPLSGILTEPYAHGGFDMRMEFPMSKRASRQGPFCMNKQTSPLSWCLH